MSNRSSLSKISSEEVKSLIKQREKLESLDFIRGSIQTHFGLMKLLEKRREFYERRHICLSEVVVWGKYLLTYRGTVQVVDQDFLHMKVGDVMPLGDFQKAVESLRTKECRIPELGETCVKCGKAFTFDDVKTGNFMPDKKTGKLIHKEECI